MWRSLSVASGDIVMFADADTSNFREQFIYGTLGPLLTMPQVGFTKAAYAALYRCEPISGRWWRARHRAHGQAAV